MSYPNHKLMPKLLLPFFNKRFSAITVLKNLSWYRSQEKLDNESIRRHEECHQKQIQELGWFKFMFLYIVYSIKYGYDKNPFEIECYKKAPITSYKSKKSTNNTWQNINNSVVYMYVLHFIIGTI